MTEYKAFSNTVVVFKEPTISQIVPNPAPMPEKKRPYWNSKPISLTS